MSLKICFTTHKIILSAVNILFTFTSYGQEIWWEIFDKHRFTMIHKTNLLYITKLFRFTLYSTKIFLWSFIIFKLFQNHCKHIVWPWPLQLNWKFDFEQQLFKWWYAFLKSLPSGISNKRLRHNFLWYTITKHFDLKIYNGIYGLYNNFCDVWDNSTNFASLKEISENIS